MRNYNLNIAGYNIRLESAEDGPGGYLLQGSGEILS